MTFAHSASDSLDFLLSAFKSSLKAFWANGSVKRMFENSDRVGRITSTEIQYSRKNGFHPHQHILIFCKKTDFDLEQLRKHWIAALGSSGLTGLSDIALDMIEAKSVENYLTKISSEISMGHLKQGRGAGHYSPMQIAWECVAGEKWAEDVFCQYFKAIRGQHFLCWSRGLKDYFGINDVSDDDISQGAAQSDLVRFMDILGDDFKKLTWSDKAKLQTCAAVNDFETAKNLLIPLGVQFWQEYKEV